MEHFMEQLLARRRCELIEGIAGSVRKGAAKSQNLLELLGWIQLDLIGPGGARGWTPFHARGGGKPFFARRDPDGDFGADVRSFVSRARYRRGSLERPFGRDCRRQSQS